MIVKFDQTETKEIALKAIELILPNQKVISVKFNYDKELEIETEPKETRNIPDALLDHD